MFSDGEEGENVYLDGYRPVKMIYIGISEKKIEKLKTKFKLNNISILVRAIFKHLENLKKDF